MTDIDMLQPYQRQAFDDLIVNPAAMTRSAATSADTSFLLEDVQRVMDDLLKEMPPVPPVYRFVQHDMATRQEPKRKHVRRRNQTLQYHRRIQKKWTKRFGTVSVPTAYVMKDFSGSAVWLVVIHPMCFAEFKRQTGDHSDRTPDAIGPGSDLSNPFAIRINWAA